MHLRNRPHNLQYSNKNAPGSVSRQWNYTSWGILGRPLVHSHSSLRWRVCSLRWPLLWQVGQQAVCPPCLQLGQDRTSWQQNLVEHTSYWSQGQRQYPQPAPNQGRMAFNNDSRLPGVGHADEAKTLTWDDVLIGRNGKTFIKHKQFSSVEPVGETLQILVDSAFQLVNIFTHFLHVVGWIRRGHE